jgi:hypothetical protein
MEQGAFLGVQKLGKHYLHIFDGTVKSHLREISGAQQG